MSYFASAVKKKMKTCICGLEFPDMAALHFHINRAETKTYHTLRVPGDPGTEIDRCRYCGLDYFEHTNGRCPEPDEADIGETLDD